MTPYSDFLSKHFPPRLTALVLVLSYSALMLGIVMFMDSGPADIIYLDVGKHN